MRRTPSTADPLEDSGSLLHAGFDDGVHIPLNFHTACAIGDYDLVRTQLKGSSAKTMVNQVNVGGWTPLMYASFVGRDTIVNLLLESG